MLRVEKPEQGTGCIILILGLVLAPVLIGIPIVIWGIVLMGKQKRHWHCANCGSIFPIA